LELPVKGQPMVQATTHNVTVAVETRYLEDDSDPDEQYFIWAYRITITNQRPDTVQLLTRYWLITDAQGRAQEVRGDGEVGEQPTLTPGKSFTYTSGVPLETGSGFMRGSYQMRNEADEKFDIEIPAFSLDCPYDGRQVH
jgi:ApaG protein